MKRYTYTIHIEPAEEGGFVVTVPALPGCVTQGETYEEALENIKDAIKLHIDARRDLGEYIPIETAIEEVEVYA